MGLAQANYQEGGGKKAARLFSTSAMSREPAGCCMDDGFQRCGHLHTVDKYTNQKYSIIAPCCLEAFQSIQSQDLSSVTRLCRC